MGNYKRLAAQDSSFVKFEDGGTHVHISAIARFERSLLVSEEGRLDVERIRSQIASRLHLIPRYRQRLAYTPVQQHPIWVDDERFDVAYHVHHTALPAPGGEQELKDCAGRIASVPLDPKRPLWELWAVEGLEGGRFAVVAKVHHSLVDGVSGVGVMIALLSPEPTTEIEPGPRWKPRPAPGLLEFVTDGLGEALRLGSSTLQQLGSSFLRPRETASSLLGTAVAGWETLRAGLTPPADTPLNRQAGSARRVDWRRYDLADIRELRKRLDGSVNDVVLSIVSGAVRVFLKQRRVKLRGLDFRVIVPVDTRTGDEDPNLGNRVSAWFLSMPVGERSARRRFKRIREQTLHLKKSRAARGVDAFLRFADFTGSTRLPFWGVNLANWVRPYNLIVTNVHGPNVPLYLLGAPLAEFTPLPPLFESQGLAVAAMSYCGRLNIGVIGDRDLVPDLDRFAQALDESFAELWKAAENS